MIQKVPVKMNSELTGCFWRHYSSYTFFYDYYFAVHIVYKWMKEKKQKNYVKMINFIAGREYT